MGGDGVPGEPKHARTDEPCHLEASVKRRLRNNLTDAEHKLRQRLRGKQIAGCKFRRQYPCYDFILDFACLERKLVVEIDGGQHAESSTDAVRDAFMGKGGFRILRFWNHEVLNQTDEVMEMIWRNLMDSGEHHPHPVPLHEGEGV